MVHLYVASISSRTVVCLFRDGTLYNQVHLNNICTYYSLIMLQLVMSVVLTQYCYAKSQVNIYHQVLIVVHPQLNIGGNTNKLYIFLNTETNHQWFDHNKKLPNALTLVELVKTKEWSPILVILARKAQENVVFV